LAVNRRRVSIGKAAPRIAAGVERGGSRISINPRQVIEDRNAQRARNRRLWESGKDDESGIKYPGYSVPGGGGRLPNSENIPDNRYFGDSVIENTEADLFAQSDNAKGDFIPLTYAPTKTAFPGNGWDHRRTIAAGYSKSQGLLRVKFYTDGSIYDYGTEHPVPPSVAKSFRLAPSPGRYINTTLNGYGYLKVE
jgi:hypothetical protein